MISLVSAREVLFGMCARTSEMSSSFGSFMHCTRSTYRYVFFASEHDTQYGQQTVQYKQQNRQRGCIQHYSPVVQQQQQQQHSGQPRARVAGLHAAVLLWLSAFFSDPRSIIPQRHTSLSDAVRDRAIVQRVGAVAHSSATPATDINTSCAEGVLTAS